MRSLDEILADYRSTYVSVEAEEGERKAIMESPEYRQHQEHIEKLQEAQNHMLAKVPDSRDEFRMDREELIRYMQEHELFRAGEFKAKTRVKRKVNTRLVLEAMGGDIDNLMLVTNIPIKNIEDFMKANPEYKKDLKRCIIEEGYTITELVLDTNSKDQ